MWQVVCWLEFTVHWGWVAFEKSPTASPDRPGNNVWLLWTHLAKISAYIISSASTSAPVRLQHSIPLRCFLPSCPLIPLLSPPPLDAHIHCMQRFSQGSRARHSSPRKDLVWMRPVRFTSERQWRDGGGRKREWNSCSQHVNRLNSSSSPPGDSPTMILQLPLYGVVVVDTLCGMKCTKYLEPKHRNGRPANFYRVSLWCISLYILDINVV